MKVLPVANAMVVLIVMIARVSISNHEIRRPVAARHVIAPVIQTRAAIIAGCTPSTTTVVAKSTAGAITAVARVAATRVRIPRTCGRASGTMGRAAGRASRSAVTRVRPVSGLRGRLIDVDPRTTEQRVFVQVSSAPSGYASGALATRSSHNSRVLAPSYIWPGPASRWSIGCSGTNDDWTWWYGPHGST